MRRFRIISRAGLAALLALLLGLGALPGQALAARGGGNSVGREAVHMAQERPSPEDRHAVVSQGVKNMVKRAYQLTDIAWTPVLNIEGWKDKDSNRFLAGVPYTGIPYGQPHRSGSYVPWQTGLPQFLLEAADPGSKLYSERSVSQVQQNVAPYYCCECSAFVSWAWGLPDRETTHTLGHYGTIVGNRMADLQVGDCMILEGKHARLVTDITYDAENRISGIEISEERAPAARRFWYLAGSTKHPLSELQTEYLDKGYIVLRCNHRDRIGYVHSCAVPMEGDICPRCGCNPYRDLELDSWYAEAAAFVKNQGIMSGTSATNFTPAAIVDRASLVTILWRAFYSPRSEAPMPFRDVKLGAYYEIPLRWAVSKGFVAGTGDRTFSPGGICTRAQIAAILWGAAGRPIPERERCPYTDVPEDAYYRDAVNWISEQGIATGVSETCFSPDSPATRAELALMIWRFCQNQGHFQ